MTLIESVPNVSEGQRPEVIELIAGAVAATAGVVLLDHSADPSHNRSVFTMASESDEAIGEAILRLVDIAVARIDLRTHQGAHPRIGAVDVVPFIPLDDTPMSTCISLARRVGRGIAERFGVPVYLYEEAAFQPERRRLEQIRSGAFEGLANKMTQPGWAPDFGPSAPHPTAGATAVGARRALIAFNVNLATDRLDAAKRIAAAVRESSRGLPGVKALGLALPDRGIVQVSMNLTNFEETPIQVVFDRIVAEAERSGVEVAESEIIGLIPEAALTGTTPAHLGLRAFSDNQILERKLAEILNSEF